MNPEHAKRERQVQAEALMADIAKAADGLGWLPPTTEEDVKTVEAALTPEATPLPEALRNPQAVFERESGAHKGPVLELAPHTDDAIGATLARAAREPGHLTPEIREAMRRDRRTAEGKQNGDDHGQNVR